MKKSRRRAKPLEITPAHVDALAQLAAASPEWAYLESTHELLDLDREGLADILWPSIHRHARPWNRRRGTQPAEPLQVRITARGIDVLEEARQAEQLSA